MQVENCDSKAILAKLLERVEGLLARILQGSMSRRIRVHDSLEPRIFALQLPHSFKILRFYAANLCRH